MGPGAGVSHQRRGEAYHEGQKNPVILLGLMASQPANSAALHKLLERSRIPVTSTYQAAGAVNQEHFTRFADASASLTTRRATGCCIWRT